jgi:pimeloyl-ACP methyl ester carboxylesterase
MNQCEFRPTVPTGIGYRCRVGVSAHEALLVPAADGRMLEVELAGPPDGVPMFSHHGTPGAAGGYEPLIDVGAERNVRHITYSRPGYGASDRHPGRTVASCAADVVSIADALGYGRFHVIGGSGGGPHSIACAALLPDRVISAATIASVAPADAAGLDWTAGMGEENVAEIAAARAGERELEAYVARVASEVSHADGSTIVGVLGDLVCEADRRALTGALGEFTVAQYARSLANGVGGWVDDDLALISPWGFELDSIAVPLTVWHGAEDRFVPVAHGEWLAAHVRAQSRLRPEHGHLSLSITSYGEILDALLDAGGGGGSGR